MRWPWQKKQQYVATVSEEWITVPFRYAEAARLSIYTIASEPRVPKEVQLWIKLWLDAYNQNLIEYMRENYGPKIFPLLDKITTEIWPNGDIEKKSDPKTHSSKGAVDQETWTKWEQEFQGGAPNE